MTDKIDDLDSFDFDMSLFGENNNDKEDFSKSVSQMTFPPTLYEILIDSGKFNREQLEELNDIVQNKSPGVGLLQGAMIEYVEAVNADSSNIAEKQEKLVDNIKKAFFPEKKGGRKKRRKRKTRRKSKKRKRKTKRRKKRRKTRKRRR